MHSLAFLGNMFGVDGLVVLVIGLLIFGRRLPEVGKNLGQTIVEFKKGLNGQVNDEPPLPPEPERPVKRVSGGGQVSVTRAKSLPSTEEV
jgi:sec-independent protein translocase protein TatA